MIVFDDIIDLIQRENTREFYEISRMHVDAGDEGKLANASVWDLLQMRAGWLIFC